MAIIPSPRRKEKLGNARVPWNDAAEGQGPAYNGVMRTTRDRIRRHPRHMYESLLNQLAEHDKCEAGHYMERAMGAAF